MEVAVMPTAAVAVAVAMPTTLQILTTTIRPMIDRQIHRLRHLTQQMQIRLRVDLVEDRILDHLVTAIMKWAVGVVFKGHAQIIPAFATGRVVWTLSDRESVAIIAIPRTLTVAATMDLQAVQIFLPECLLRLRTAALAMSNHQTVVHRMPQDRQKTIQRCHRLVDIWVLATVSIQIQHQFRVEDHHRPIAIQLHKQMLVETVAPIRARVAAMPVQSPRPCQRRRLV